MTIIAYRSGIMAADTGSNIGGTVSRWSRKIARGPDGTLYGVTGLAAPACDFLEWVKNGCQGHPPRPENIGDTDNSFLVLIATPSGEISLLYAKGTERFEMAPYMAVGAGADVAMGAMFCGRGAEIGVAAAIEHCSVCFGDVYSVRHDG